VHDYKTALTPVLAKDIKYFNVPHYFELTKVQGKAILRYANFASSRQRDHRGDIVRPMQPPLPAAIIIPAVNLQNESIRLLMEDDFAYVDGYKTFLEYNEVNVQGALSQRHNLTSKEAKIIADVTGMNERFKDLQMKVANLGYEKATSEFQDLTWQPTFTFQDMKRMCSHESGYICWLTLDVARLRRIVPQVKIPDATQSFYTNGAQTIAATGVYESYSQVHSYNNNSSYVPLSHPCLLLQCFI
jgi:hypothetical protein